VNTRIRTAINALSCIIQLLTSWKSDTPHPKTIGEGNSKVKEIALHPHLIFNKIKRSKTQTLPKGTNRMRKNQKYICDNKTGNYHAHGEEYVEAWAQSKDDRKPTKTT
jgi:hypothetical protein